MDNNLNEDVNVIDKTSPEYVDNRNMVMPGDTISANKYNLYIGLTLLWGFLINFLLVNFIDAETLMMHPILLLVGYFISAFIGSMMCNRSSNPVISFIGYNLIAVPIGLVLNVCLYGYSNQLISTAVLITGTVTLLMMFLGTTFPSLFAKIGRALGVSLLITLIVEVVSLIFFPAFDGMIIDYIVVLIFCGYIGVDWGRANMVSKTVDNAIDSASQVYLDIINLFLRILSILARNNRNR